MGGFASCIEKSPNPFLAYKSSNPQLKNIFQFGNTVFFQLWLVFVLFYMIIIYLSQSHPLSSTFFHLTHSIALTINSLNCLYSIFILYFLLALKIDNMPNIKKKTHTHTQIQLNTYIDAIKLNAYMKYYTQNPSYVITNDKL